MFPSNKEEKTREGEGKKAIAEHLQLCIGILLEIFRVLWIKAQTPEANCLGLSPNSAGVSSLPVRPWASYLHPPQASHL